LYQSDVGRAMKRDLIDYFVEIKNPLESSDVRKVTLGIAKGLGLENPQSFQQLSVPIKIPKGQKSEENNHQIDNRHQKYGMPNHREFLIIIRYLV